MVLAPVKLLLDEVVIAECLYLFEFFVGVFLAVPSVLGLYDLRNRHVLVLVVCLQILVLLSLLVFLTIFVRNCKNLFGILWNFVKAPKFVIFWLVCNLDGRD